MASMTKEELKNALINHGAPVPPTSAKKEEFIQAYEEHVGPVLEDAAEFSSDTELSTPKKKKASQASRRSTTGSASKFSTSSSASKLSSSSRKSNGGSPKKSPKKSVEDSADIEMNVDIGSLDDDQLFEMLQKNGLEVGPIVASTRKFYEKKLAVALTGVAPRSVSNGYSDTEPEDDSEEEEDSEQPGVHVSRTLSPRSSTKASGSGSDSGLRQRLALSESVDSSPTTLVSPRRAIHSYKVTETTRQVTTRARDGTETTDTKHWVERTESTGAKPTTNASSKPWISGLLYLLLKLIIVCILVVGLYVAFTTPSDGVTPVDKVLETINSALPPKDALKDTVEEVHFEAPTVTEAPPIKKLPIRDPAPEAGNVVDV